MSPLHDLELLLVQYKNHFNTSLSTILSFIISQQLLHEVLDHHSTMAISCSKYNTSAATAAAALLLMVTVLVSGADAQFTITNTCNRTITITSPTGGNLMISPTNTITVTTPPVSFFTGATGTIGLPTATGSVSFAIPATVTTLLNAFQSLTGSLLRIVITCQGNCVTFTGVFQFPIVGPVSVQLGQVCPLVVTP